jgi:prevent-host-death family protein
MWTKARIAETAAVPYGSPRLRSIPAGEFKAKCLELMDQVHDRHESIVVTKHGVPVAKLVPYEQDIPDIFGFLKGTVLSYGDIVSPIDVEWDAIADS